MSEQNPILTTPLAIVVAGAIIGGAVYASSRPVETQNTETVAGTQQDVGSETLPEKTVPSDPIDVSIEDEPFIGDENAPVTVVEFTDYQCPFCKRFNDDTFSQVKEQYVDTGKVKYVFRDFPLSFHQNADEASNAANCAFDQGGADAYLAYHDTLFAKQDEWSGLSDPGEKMKEYAGGVGLKTGDFASCYDSGKYNDEVNEDLADGQVVGVGGTPSFFVNGRLLVGAQPFSEFQRVIDEELGG